MIPESVSALNILKPILVVTIGIGVAGGLLAWRERPEPGAVPLAALLAGQSWWSASLFFKLTATTLSEKLFWDNVAWLGVVVIPVAWLLFSLEYTGHSQYSQRRYVVLLTVIPAITALLGLTDGFHQLLYTDSELIRQNGALVLNRTPGIWLWVITAYTYLLGLIGAIPLLQFVISDISIFQRQSVALLVGLTAPWTTNVLYLLGVLPTNGVDPTPVAFSISGAAYLGALTRFQLIGTSPAPIRQGRQTAFEQMQQGALVLDRRDHVVNMNERAAGALRMDPTETLGRSIRDVIPDYDTLVADLQSSEGSVYRPEDGREAYDVSVNELTDIHGRVTGRIVILHDISDLLRQQQRLEVLNRIFRHNVRTNLQIITGYTETLGLDENGAAKVRRNAAEIEEISEKIRKVLTIFERQREPTQSVALENLLHGCVSTVREDHPEVRIDWEVDAVQTRVDESLREILLEVIRNAAEHNTDPDPQVRIEATSNEDYARVQVADNGPGIDESELALLEEGSETPLKHGSGVGLALIIWGTEIIGGEVSFEDNDPTGLVVTLKVPVASRAEQEPSSRSQDTRSSPTDLDYPTPRR